MRQLIITKSITKRDTTSFEKYLQEIGKIELITPEDEILLAQKVRKGNQGALNKLVNANLRFVVSVAKQYQHRGLSIQDLVNEGNMGLIKAAKLYDETRGFKFISYAVWWIRQSILAAIVEKSRIVRIPVNKVGAISKINKISMKFQQEHDRMPSSEELAELMNVSEYKIKTYLNCNQHQVSIDAPSREDKDKKMIDFMEDKKAIAPEQPLINQSLNYEIKRLINTLPKKEQKVLIQYYGLEGRPHSLIEIGRNMNISRERARQIKNKAIRKLKKPVKQKLLTDYLASNF